MAHLLPHAWCVPYERARARVSAVTGAQIKSIARTATVEEGALAYACYVGVEVAAAEAAAFRDAPPPLTAEQRVAKAI